MPCLAIEACNHPIRCIEHIQAHGVVLVVNANDLTGLQVSENVEQFLRLKAIDLVGQPLDILSIPQLTRRVSWFLRQEGEVGPNSFELMLPMPVTQLVADASTASARQAPPCLNLVCCGRPPIW
jgi:light-regulated signal transduction histidine kinase (bacteriophytochrome)